jgi:hypothetical protein
LRAQQQHQQEDGKGGRQRQPRVHEARDQCLHHAQQQGGQDATQQVADIVLFFTIETLFGASGVAYLIGLGATALLFALLMPRGIWGEIEARLGLQLLPVGYRLNDRQNNGAGHSQPKQ